MSGKKFLKMQGAALFAVAAVLTLTAVLVPGASAAGKYKVLYSFKGRAMYKGYKDGDLPLAGLTFSAGNLYGTTFRGGVYNDGTVFQLTPNGKGGWTENVLHLSFNCEQDRRV